ncbi:MAG: transglutaminase domain-containing protein [Firmicutes bacterium]|nr:transglutaminase domain-containing protein [Bacillota bacterium]
MNQKKNSGMWIRQTASAEKQDRTWIISMLLVIAATELLLLILTQVTSFSVICPPWVMLLAAGGACVVFQMMERGRKWISLAATLVVFLFVCICGKQILGGACLFWNQLGDAWTAQTGIVLPAVELSIAHGNESVQLILFSVMLGYTVGAVLWFVARCSKQLLAVMMPVVVFVLMAAFQTKDTLWYLMPVLLLSICLLLYDTKENGNFVANAIRWAVVLLCCGIMAIGAVQPGVVKWAQDIGEQTKTKVHEIRYETAYTTLPEGDLSAKTEEGSQSEAALVVNMEQPEQMYLRGFTGADFAEACWTPLDTKKLAEQEDLLYWLNVSNLNPHGQYAAAASLTMNETEQRTETQTITVQNVNACSQYMYVPYTLYGNACLDAENISSDGVRGNRGRNYLYQTLIGGAEKISSLSGYLQAQDDEKAKAYLEAEQHYREFVYDQYVTIPEDMLKSLQPYWEKAAKGYGDVEELTWEEAQECVLRFMEAYSKEEDSFQRATTTVLTLRYFGIPARYAEGYMITDELAEKAEEGTILVDGSQACAWAEVYKDGLGWIPMQELPGMEDEFKPLNPNAEGEHLPQDTPPEPDLSQEEPELQQEKPQTENGFVVALEENKPLVLLLFFIPVFLIFAVLAARRKVLLNKRAVKWNETEVRDAVAWIFADTADLLKRLGFFRGNGSMRNLLIPAEEQMGSAYAAEFAKMIDLNDRAVFSSKSMDEDARETAKEFYAATLQQLLKPARWHKKMWMRWILCLY